MKDLLIKCKKCGYDEDASKIHLHHIIPRSLGGTDKDGKCYICEKCHHIWHNMIPSIIWRFVDNKEKAREKLRISFLWYLRWKK